MPESSVKIKLGIELDKSELGQQIQEMQKELEQYKLKIGITTEQLEDESGGDNSQQAKAGTSFESGADEIMDFGPLSDLANDKFSQVTDGFNIVSDHLSGIFAEVKDINDTLKSLFPQESKADKQESRQPDSTPSSTNDELNSVAEKILDQLVGLSDLVSNIASTLEGEKSPAADAGGVESGKDSKPKPPSSEKESEKESGGGGNSAAINDAIAAFNQLIESVGNPGAILEEIVDIATETAEELLKGTIKALSVLGEDVVKIVSGLLGDSLEGIQGEVIKILESTLQGLITQLLDSFSGNKEKGGGKEEGFDTSNISSAISSASSSILGLLSRLQDILGDLLNPIVSQLLPAILTQLEFDFFKSLIGGAVAKLGSALVAQSAGGAAKLAEGVITGNLFRGQPSDGSDVGLLDSGDPAEEAVKLFGEGFAANDPALLSKEFTKLQKALLASADATPLSPETVESIDSGIDTVQMTAVLEDIAMGIGSANEFLAGIKDEFAIADSEDDSQGVLVAELDNLNTTAKQILQLQGSCTCEASFDQIATILGEVVGRLDETNQLLSQAPALLELPMGDDTTPLNPQLGDGEPVASDSRGFTDVNFEDLLDVPKLALPPAIDEPIVNGEFDPSTLYDNVAKIAENVFGSLGMSLDTVMESGAFPTVGIDKDNKLGGQSQYDRTSNKIVLGEETAKNLGSSSNIQREDFAAVARELRAAIQTVFGNLPISQVSNKAKRGESLPVGKTTELPLLKLTSLLDPSKGQDVVETVNDKTSLNTNPKLEKGVRALNMDATVFAENLSDIIFGGQPLTDANVGRPQAKKEKQRRKKETEIKPTEAKPPSPPKEQPPLITEIPKLDDLDLTTIIDEINLEIPAADIPKAEDIDLNPIIEVNVDIPLEEIKSDESPLLTEIPDPSNIDLTDIIPDVILESPPIDDNQDIDAGGSSQGQEFDPELLFANFIRIAEQVFSSIGVQLENITGQGLLPEIVTDTDNKLGDIPSDYDSKKNRVLINEDTAQRLGTSAGVSKDDFVLIARELRRAIQTAFGNNKDFKLNQQAARGEVPFGSGKIPLSKLSGLSNASKGEDVLEDVNARMLGNRNPSAEKGVRALQIDADVFAQNLADANFPSGGELPDIQSLFRAEDTSLEDLSLDELSDYLQQLVQGNEQLIVLNRESIQGERSNLDRLSGDSLIDDSVKQLGAGAPTNFEKISTNFKRVVDTFGGNLTKTLKNLSVNAGIPNTRWVDKLNIIASGLDTFTKLLNAVNPDLSDAFTNLVKTVQNDAADLLVAGVAAVPGAVTGGIDAVKNKGAELLDGEEVNGLMDDIAAAIEQFTNQAFDFAAPKIEQAKEIGSNLAGSAKEKANELVGVATELIPPELLSFLQGFAQRLNSLGSSLLAGIGQLVVALKGLVANSDTASAATDFLSGVEKQLKTTSEKMGVDSLFRSDSEVGGIADPWETEALPQGTEIPIPLSQGQGLADIPDPWVEKSGELLPVDPTPVLPPTLIDDAIEQVDSKPRKGSTESPMEGDGAPKGFNLANFLQKTLPVAIAGLVVAKLGTSLLNKLVPGKQNVEREINVNNLQSALTKALVGAVAIAIGQKLLPQLSGLINPDKNVGMLDRIKSVFTRKPDRSTEIVSDDLAFDEISTAKGSSPIFPDLDRLAPIEELFRSSQSASMEASVAPVQEVTINDALAELKQALLNIPSTLKSVMPEIKQALLELPGMMKTYYMDITGNIPMVTEHIPTAISAVANSGQPKLDDKQSDLPKIIALAITAGLAKNAIGSVIQSKMTGQPRQDSLIEKLFKGISGFLVGKSSVTGKSIDKGIAKSPLNIMRGDSMLNNIFNGILNKSFAGMANKALGRDAFGSKKGAKGSTDTSSPGIFESLFSKLPIVLTALIIGGLLSRFIPSLLAGLSKTTPAITDAAKLANPGEQLGFDSSRAPIMMDVESATKLAKEAAAKSGLPKNQRADLEQQLINDYTTDPLGAQFDKILANAGGTSDLIDMDALTANFDKIAAGVFAASGLSPEKVANANLMPNLRVDTENKLGGVSSYTPRGNTVNLSPQVAQGLSSGEGIAREDFVTLVHELRHAVQLAFGKNNIAGAAKTVMDGNPLLAGRSTNVDLKTTEQLIDPTKANAVASQARASTSLANGGDLTEGIQALELDAEVFAQNLSDVFYGMEQGAVEQLPRANNPEANNIDSLAPVLETGIDSVESLEKVLNEYFKNLKRNLSQGNRANATQRNKQQDIVVLGGQQNILENKPLLGADKANLAPDSLPDISPDIDIKNIVPEINQEDNDGTSNVIANKLLTLIKNEITKIGSLLEQISIKLVNQVQPGDVVGAQQMGSLDALFRGAPESQEETEDKKKKDTESTGAVKIGERIGNKLVSGIENVQGRLNKRMQDAGMDEDDIRGLTDQAGAYMFANLSAFFPAGAIGVALTPVIASLSALGIPIAAAVNQLAPIGQMLADTMRTMQPIQTRFETIGGSEEKGDEMLLFAENVATDLNTPLLASIEGYSRLTAASKGSKLEGQDTEELFIGVSQAMAALGLNAQDASLIFLAFQQVISKGKVAAEELRGQIGERLPGAIQLAAESLGMTVADFSKALDNGEISANVLLPKLAKAMQEEYGAGAEAASKGFLGTLNRIENSLFNLRRIFVDEFGGILAGFARVAAGGLDLVVKFIDNVLLKSGLMFNAILGIHAQIIAGTAFIFSKLNLPLALAKALSGGYGKLSLVLIPFFFGLFQEIIGTVLAKVFGIEISNAIEMITGFFSQVVGRVIQTVIDLSDDPKQVLEGLVNLARSIGTGVVTASTAFLNMAITIRDQFGGATGVLVVFINKLAQAERLINKIADSSIGKIYAPQVDTPEGQAPQKQQGLFGGIGEAFNGKAIARASLEFFGLFVIMIQTMVLLRIIGEHVLKVGGAFKVFAADFSKALMSMKTGKSILSMLTLGFTGFNLVLAGLVTLIALMAFKSDSVNTFLSELSNSVKDLEKLNTNLDQLTNRKIDITTRITQLDEEGYRDTPFQDKGLTLSFWRDRSQEQFTTDDVIRGIQRQIDSNAYRRDLPILPENYNQGQGSMVDADNIENLGRNLVSREGRQNTPENFTEIIELRKQLIRERSLLEEDLTLRLGLDVTNVYDEINKLKNRLGGIDKDLVEVNKNISFTEKSDGVGIFGAALMAERKLRTKEPLRSSEVLRLMRGGPKDQGIVRVLSSGASDNYWKVIFAIEKLILAQEKAALESNRTDTQSQISALERQTDFAPGSTVIIEENSVEAYVTELEQSLNRVNNELNVERNRTVNPMSIPTMASGLTGGGIDSINELARLNRIESLERQQKSLGETIALTEEHIWGLNRQYEDEIKARQDLIKELENPPNNAGKTGRQQNQREIANLRTEIETLTIQSQAAMAEPARREIDRINQDLRALEVFANMPGVFNNAFNQDDTVLREIVGQQLDVFSMVQNERINPQRLDEGNVVQVLPRLIDDVESRRENLLGRRQALRNEIDLLANPDNNLGRRQELERELAQLDASRNRTEIQRRSVEGDLSRLSTDESSTRRQELEQELAQITANQSVTTQQRQSVEQELAQLPVVDSSARRQGLESELARLDVTSNAATEQRQQIERELAQLSFPDSTNARRDELTQQLSQLDLSSNAVIQQRQQIEQELAQLPEISFPRPDLERELAQLDLSRDAANTRRQEIESELTGLSAPDTSRRVAIEQELATIAAELAANQQQGEVPRASEELQSTINSLVRVLQTSDVGSLASTRFQASPIMQNLPVLEETITRQLAQSQITLDAARNARAQVADSRFFETPYEAEEAGILNEEDIKRLNNLLRVEIKSRDDTAWLRDERLRLVAEAERVEADGGDGSELLSRARDIMVSEALNTVDVEPRRREILSEAGARAGLPAYQFDRNLREELIVSEGQVEVKARDEVADLSNQLALIEKANQLMLTGQAQVTGIDPELNELLKQRKIALENELSLLQSASDVTATRKQELEKELEQIVLSSAAIARRRESVLDSLEQSPSIPGVSRRDELEKTLAALTSQIDNNSQNRQQIEQELAQLPAVDTDREVRKRELEQQLSQTDLITQRTDTERKQLEKELADLIAGDDTANRRQQLESDLARILQTQDSANRQRLSVEQELAQLPASQARTPQQMQVEVELAELDLALQQTNARRGELQAELDNLDLTSGNAQERLGELNQELKALDKELVGLKGLDIFLGIAQSYSDLGAGKQVLDERRVTRALAALSTQLGDSPIQSEAVQQFRETPTLPNLAQLEQSILIQLPTARQGLSRAESERENVLNTPFLRNERDLRGAGLVSRDQKAELDLLSAQEKRLSDAIADTRSEVTKAYQEYNQTLTDGLDFQPALDGYRAVQDELKVLTKQLQDLRNERNKVLDEVKELAPPIQVDATARQQRLDSVDGAISDAEARVNELLKQFQLIQDTKLALGGTGQIGEGLELAADELRKPLKGFAAFRENFANATWLSGLALPSREKRAVEMESRAAQLNPALGNLSRFVAQQQDLSPGARQGLTGALNSGNFSLTQQALESIEIADGKIYFGGEELDGTPEEVKAFTEALKTATKVLNLIGGDSSDGSKPVQEALAEGLGIQTKTTEREAITASYQQQIANLATKGVFTESQLTALTQGGIKVEEAQAILDTVRNQDGLSNWQSTMERLQAQGVSEGDRRDIFADIERLDQVFVDALALDPKGAAKVRLGTVGEEEYNQTVGKLDEIAGLARDSSLKLGLQYYDGDLQQFETAIEDVKPGLLDNIAQLRKLESELDFLGGQRMLLAEQLKRTDLTKEERRQVEKDSTRLDTEFKNKYREKAVAGEELTASFDLFKGVDKALLALEEKIKTSDLSKGIKDSLLGQIDTIQKEDITPALDLFGKYEDLMAQSGEEALEAANKAIAKAMENFEKSVLIIEATTSKKLADISTALREFANNTNLGITTFDKAVAGLPGDPVRLRAEQGLAIAQVNAEQSRQKREAAQLAKNDVDREVNKVERRTAFDSPIEALEAVEVVKQKQRESQTALSEAEQEYSANLTALAEAQLAALDAQVQAPVRISQINSKGISNARKQQQLTGGITREEVERLKLDDEIGLLDIELAATETALQSISAALVEGTIPDVTVANAKIEELVNTQQDLIANRLDKALERENQQRERNVKLLENQTSLSSKYFDVAITGYEALNKASERFSRQLDSLTKIGDELKNLSQAQFQVKIGLSEDRSNIIDIGRGITDNLATGELSPKQQNFQQRRLRGIQQLGNQTYGIRPSAFSSNEDTALAEQQKIATQMAKDKLEALEKEQAIAAKLLAIEIKRNEVAAEMAVKEAEIGQLRAEQAAIQAQLALRQAIIQTANSEDKTPVLLAELELAIANSQLDLAGEEVGVANQNKALQSLFADLQKQAFDATSEASRDDAIMEIIGNENVDVSKLITALNNFKDFDPSKVSAREVFEPYLDWIKEQTPRRDPNTPIGLPLEEFNGDIQAWVEANVKIAQEEQAKMKPPKEVSDLKQLFDQVFGEEVATQITMENGKVQDINAELQGKKAATKKQLESQEGKKEIADALAQGRRLAEATDPIDSSRMASDIYSVSTSASLLVSDVYSMSRKMGELIDSNLVVQKLLGNIDANTSLGTNQATPAATEAVEEFMGVDISGLREILAPIVGADEPSAITPVSAEEFEALMDQTNYFPEIPTLPEFTTDSSVQLTPDKIPVADISSDEFQIPGANPLTKELDGILEPDLPDLPALPPEFSSIPGQGSVNQVATNILNPTIQNRVNPSFSPPAINVAAQRRDPGYFYRNLANEVRSGIGYREPVGVQANQEVASNSTRPGNTTINITNKIDANTQREMYAKIGEIQTQAIISALGNLA